MIRFLFVFLFIYTSLLADYVVITSNGNRILVTDESIFIDSTKKLGICEVSAPERASKFFRSAYPDAFVKFYSANYWLRLKVNNLTGKPIVLYREATFKEVQLFHEVSNGDFVEIPKVYDNLNFNVFLLKRQEFIFQSNYLPGPQTYYLKFTPSSKQYVGVSIDSYESYFRGTVNTTMYYGIFFGIVLIIALSSIIIGITVNELLYIFYAIYVLALGVFAASVWFIVPMNHFNDHQFLSIFNISYSLMTIALLQYTRLFFQTSRHLKFENQVLLFMIGYKVCLIVAQIWVIPEGILFDNLFDMSMLLFALYIGFKMQSQGFKASRFFIIGFIIIITGYGTRGFNGFIYENNQLKYPILNFIFTNYLYYASIAEILLFFVSLSDRFRLLKLEITDSQLKLIETLKENQQIKDQINADLENKVQERTLTIRKQALEIARINSLLRSSNQNLKTNLKRAESARIENKLYSFQEFKEIYPNEDSCKDMVAQLKWSNEYYCKKCGNDKYSLLKDQFSRRCTKCSYVESPTNGTILNNVKFDLVKAFYLIYIANSGKKVTINKLSEDLELRKQTCIEFNKKIAIIINTLPKRKRNLEDWKQLIVTPLELQS